MIERFVSRLRNRLFRHELPVWYAPAYRLPMTGIEASVGIEPRRSDYAAWWLVDSNSVAPSSLRLPRRASYAELDRVHTLELIESLGHAETLARIFAVDASDVPVDELLNTVRLSCGGTIEAAREALRRRGPTLNLQGGFHHAGPNSAGGNCPVNDVAIAVAALRAEGFGGRVVVLDLDAHPPDGITACLQSDRSAWIGSISGSDWGRLPGVDETVLREGAGDALYLTTLAGLLGRMPKPALAFVLAGGDVLAGDRFGRLGLTVGGARRRDRAVARALQETPSVWLPGGGYHRDAWRVLAGTGMVLALDSEESIPDDYHPLGQHFETISDGLSAVDRSSGDLTSADLEEAFGLSPPRQDPLLLGNYSAASIEHALYRYGVFDQLTRVGYSGFRVSIDHANPGERVAVSGEADGAEHLLIEMVLERRRLRSKDVLYIHWLSLRNPRARFSAVRPPLPGQEVPGLGIASEMIELISLITRRLQLAGVAFRPSHYHVAYGVRHAFAFVDAPRQGRFEALLRDLGHLPMLQASSALAEGRASLGGVPYEWEADEMASWLDPPVTPSRDAQIARERARCRFTLRPSIGGTDRD